MKKESPFRSKILGDVRYYLVFLIFLCLYHKSQWWNRST